MIETHAPGLERRITVGADKGYDTADFAADLMAMSVTPHVAQNNKGRASATAILAPTLCAISLTIDRPRPVCRATIRMRRERQSG